MKLLEYEAKRILRKYDILTPTEVALVSPGEKYEIDPPHPLVIKSQVPVGGRGKAGGVLLAKDRPSLEEAINKIANTRIQNYLPNKILIEKALDIDRELYLSLTINSTTVAIDVLAHPSGGVEVESQDNFSTLNTDRPFSVIGESLAEIYHLESHAFALAELIENLYRCFINNDMTLLEINPLILTKQGNLVAGDCKVTLDDNALFRHPNWNFEDKPANKNFVYLDPEGKVATIANGAGLAMATVDAIKSANLSPANFLDLGGKTTTDDVVKSLSLVTQLPNIEAIIVNIFGGIVRCDDVASAIIQAKKHFEYLPKLYVRLSGTGSKEAFAILGDEDLVLCPDLSVCIQGIQHG